jgi:hypothetical protein
LSEGDEDNDRALTDADEHALGACSDQRLAAEAAAVERTLGDVERKITTLAAKAGLDDHAAQKGEAVPVPAGTSAPALALDDRDLSDDELLRQVNTLEDGARRLTERLRDLRAELQRRQIQGGADGDAVCVAVDAATNRVLDCVAGTNAAACRESSAGGGRRVYYQDGTCQYFQRGSEYPGNVTGVCLVVASANRRVQSCYQGATLERCESGDLRGDYRQVFRERPCASYQVGSELSSERASRGLRAAEPASEAAVLLDAPGTGSAPSESQRPGYEAGLCPESEKRPATLRVVISDQSLVNEVLRIDGRETQMTGSPRHFESPPVCPSRGYYYVVQLGLTTPKSVQVRGGQTTEVSLP